MQWWWIDFDRLETFAEGGRAMLGQAGFGVLLNFFIEFYGDINRKIGAKSYEAGK